MMPYPNSMFLNIRGKKQLTRTPPININAPTYLYKYPKTERISCITIRLLVCNGLNKKKLMHPAIPNSARFKYPNILDRVPYKPIKSAPRLVRKIFLEKKDKKRVMK